MAWVVEFEADEPDELEELGDPAAEVEDALFGPSSGDWSTMAVPSSESWR